MFYGKVTSCKINYNKPVFRKKSMWFGYYYFAFLLCSGINRIKSIKNFFINFCKVLFTKSCKDCREFHKKFLQSARKKISSNLFTNFLKDLPRKLSISLKISVRNFQIFFWKFSQSLIRKNLDLENSFTVS